MKEAMGRVIVAMRSTVVGAVGFTAVATLAAAVTTASAQTPDHLKCYKVKDSAAKARYTADLGGLDAEPGCLIKVPGTMLCVETRKQNVSPTPPGAPDGPSAGRFVCYKVKCPKALLAPIVVSDQFGTRSVQPTKPKMLCAPAGSSTTTSTTTTTLEPTTTSSSTTTTTINSAPIAVNDAYSTDEDSLLSVPAPGVLANDTDANGDMLVSILISGPAHGVLTLGVDGSFVYAPALDYNGPDSFTYRASDGTASSNIATVDITVNAVDG